jgi:hypothetical protein
MHNINESTHQFVDPDIEALFKWNYERLQAQRIAANAAGVAEEDGLPERRDIRAASILVSKYLWLPWWLSAWGRL